MLSIYFKKILTCAKLHDFEEMKQEYEKAFSYVENNVGFSSIYVKYNFSDVEVLVEDNMTTVTGKLTHNGATKENLTIAIPCFNKKGVKMGDATDTIGILEKNDKWDFTAILHEGDVKYCKINDTYITINSGN